MYAFSKLRFPKTSLVIFFIGALVLLAIPLRIMMGATPKLPAHNANFQNTIFPELVFPILIIGLSFLLLSLLLWLLLRNKGFRFMDLGYPISTLGAIAIFIFFHFTLF